MGAAFGCASESLQIDASNGFPSIYKIFIKNIATIPQDADGSKLHTDLNDLNSKLAASIEALKHYDKSYGDKIKEVSILTSLI